VNATGVIATADPTPASLRASPQLHRYMGHPRGGADAVDLLNRIEQPAPHWPLSRSPELCSRPRRLPTSIPPQLGADVIKTLQPRLADTGC
jgi:hypothetical protein